MTPPRQFASDSSLVIPGVPVRERRHSRVLQSPLAAPRAGVMLHYDDSTRDDWALAWFDDPRCTNGYTWLVLRDGTVVELADPALRTPHAGACLTPNANSCYYGVSAATNGVMLATNASPGQGTLQVAAEMAPAGLLAVVFVRDKKSGAGLRYTITDQWLAKIVDWNKNLDPAGRYQAAMSAPGLFEVAPAL